MPSQPLEDQQQQQQQRQQRESPHKALIGLWKHTDRAWIGFRKPGDGEGCRGRLNRTHASFLNSLAGPKRGERIRGWGGGKEKKVLVVGGGGVVAGMGWGLFNASLILNATANAEKLHNLLKSPLRDVHAQTHAHRNKETGKGGGVDRGYHTHTYTYTHTH